MKKDDNKKPNASSPVKTKRTLSEDEKYLKLINGEALDFYSPQHIGHESNAEKAARTIPSLWLMELLEESNYTISKPIRISNAIIKGPVLLRYAVFQYELSITGSTFTDEVDLSFATFKRIITFEGSTFQKPPDFRYAHAESYFSISRCFFPDDTAFTDINIDESLYAESTFFGSVSFTRATVGKSAFFRPYNPSMTRPIVNAKQIIPACSEYDGKPVCTHNAPVHFNGKVTFDDARFGSTVEFKGTQFNGRALFQGVQINGSALFYPYDEICVCFNDQVRFCYTTIKDNADFSAIQCKKEADFENIQIGGLAVWGTYTKGQTIAIRKSEPDPDEKKIQFNSRFSGQATFSRACFNGAVSFEGACFEEGAAFDGCKAEGPADFRGTVFKNFVSFCEARFRTVLFRNTLTGKAPEKKQFMCQVDFRGLSYEFISVAWRELFNEQYAHQVEEEFNYHRQPYSQLENTLRTMGLGREADKVYLVRRKHEARQRWNRVLRKNKGEKLSIWQVLPELLVALFDLFQRLLFNYGIRPLRLLWLSLLVIIVGTYIFAQADAVKNKQREEQQVIENLTYSQALGVSLRLFIPIVDLPTGEQWTPTDKPSPYLKFSNLSFAGYATLHRLAGAILVPLGIAALTGFMHRRTE